MILLLRFFSLMYPLMKHGILKGTLPEVITSVNDITVAFDFYDPTVVFTAAGNRAC